MAAVLSISRIIPPGLPACRSGNLPLLKSPCPVENAGLLAIDHIGQTMDIHVYRSLFNVRKTPLVDIIDPVGVVRSQVIENRGGSLRITLNGAENRRTLAGHFLAEKFGSGIQHVAFSTDDIFATADNLQKNGFTSLG